MIFIKHFCILNNNTRKVVQLTVKIIINKKGKKRPVLDGFYKMRQDQFGTFLIKTRLGLDHFYQKKTGF